MENPAVRPSVARAAELRKCRGAAELSPLLLLEVRHRAAPAPAPAAETPEQALRVLLATATQGTVDGAVAAFLEAHADWLRTDPRPAASALLACAEQLIGFSTAAPVRRAAALLRAAAPELEAALGEGAPLSARAAAMIEITIHAPFILFGAVWGSSRSSRAPRRGLIVARSGFV